MSEISTYAQNTFCWEDLYTSDLASAKTFYQGMFSWKIEDLRSDDTHPYSFFTIKGKEVCGLTKIQANLQQQKITPHWRTYVSVPNADDVVQVAKIAGATIIDPARDKMEAGRSALIQDPTGALIALWQPKRKIGALVAEVPGSACWRELLTSNLDVAGKFYATVFSWNPRPEKFGDMAYVTLKSGDTNVAGMMEMQKEGIPSYWLTYWAVKDCEKSLKKAETLGGKILKPTTSIKKVGKFAVVADPQGAVFAILQSEKE
ncbi:MAG: hypothetical protein A2X86_14420 [Bdellovibrionales bacterium GWA2_49_15]|nr:MAG: hypothetical protein A2X86_14420 [Bdellovibrionales bacterium GWA2_49_15]HAZ13837.1 hypothetical protein [Bdellovibrionales bacterium]